MKELLLDLPECGPLRSQGGPKELLPGRILLDQREVIPKDDPGTRLERILRRSYQTCPMTQSGDESGGSFRIQREEEHNGTEQRAFLRARSLSERSGSTKGRGPPWERLQKAQGISGAGLERRPDKNVPRVEQLLPLLKGGYALRAGREEPS